MNIGDSMIDKIISSESLDNELIFSTPGKFYTFLNPVSYLTAVKHKELFVDFDGIFADGAMLVRAIGLFYRKKIRRRSLDMTSMAQDLFTYANVNRKSVCIVASKQEMLENALSVLCSQYPDIEWRGCRDGYFASQDEMRATASRIAEENADFLIVGMGIGLQEQFLMMCKEAGYKGIGFTCGGFIHQISDGNFNYYNEWVDRYNLRFLYRFWKEPHTRLRYIHALLVFPFFFLKERLFASKKSTK